MFSKKGFLPAFIFFDVVTIAVVIFRERLFAAGINAWIIIAGNAIFFIVTMLSMYMNAKAMAHGNTHGFIRNVYGGFLLKFVIIIAATVAYVVSVKEINKSALLCCLGLYLVYTFLGTRNVLNNQKTVKDGNGKSTV